MNRYYGIGATYDIGDLQLVATVDSINYASYGSYKSKIDDDSLTVTVGGNYNFGVIRIYAMGQYRILTFQNKINGFLQSRTESRIIFFHIHTK